MSENAVRALPRRQRRRAAIAFVLAPITAAFALTFVAWLITLAAHLSTPLPSLMRGWAITSALLLATMLTLGWGYHAVAFRQRWRSAPGYILACGALGVLAAATAAFIYMRNAHMTDVNASTMAGVFVAAALLFSPPSALMGWVFWLIRRPDRDHETDPLHVFD